MIQKINTALWRFLAAKKLSSRSLPTKIQAIQLLAKYGKPEDQAMLLPLINERNNAIRLSATVSLRTLFRQDQSFKQALLDHLQNASVLTKLTIIEILQELPLEEREEIFADTITTATDDILYAVVQALKGTTDINLLDAMLKAADTKDLVLRKTAYLAWFQGIANMEKEDRIQYATPRIHQLIRATYETKDKGTILQNILAYADRKELPEPKAYPEFIIRYLIELINTWEYDPDVNRAIHQLVVPAYFTFREREQMQERPYIQI